MDFRLVAIVVIAALMLPTVLIATNTSFYCPNCREEWIDINSQHPLCPNCRTLTTLPTVLTATNTSFHCDICSKTRSGFNPTILRCSHAFCPECIASKTAWNSNPRCPTCYRPAKSEREATYSIDISKEQAVMLQDAWKGCSGELIDLKLSGFHGLFNIEVTLHTKGCATGFMRFEKSGLHVIDTASLEPQSGVKALFRAKAQTIEAHVLASAVGEFEIEAVEVVPATPNSTPPKSTRWWFGDSSSGR